VEHFSDCPSGCHIWELIFGACSRKFAFRGMAKKDQTLKSSDFFFSFINIILLVSIIIILDKLAVVSSPLRTNDTKWQSFAEVK